MKKGLLILCFVSFAALACTIVNRYITGTVELSGFSSTVEQHRDVADALGATYGSLHQNTEILALTIPVKACLLGVCRASTIRTLKPCGKTMEETLDDLAADWERRIAMGGGDSPTPDGPGGSGYLGNPYDPFAGSCGIVNPQVCTQTPEGEDLVCQSGEPELVCSA